METITTKKGQKSSKSNAGISKIIFSSLILLAVIMASGCIDLDEKELPEENCDSKHLSLCDNENDCENVGGYWYNNQCNEEKKEKSEEEPPLKDYFDKCQPIKETRVMGENIDIKVLYEIKGEVEGKCEVYEKVVEDNTGYGFEGKEMTCLIPMTIITEGTALSDDDVRTYCTGSLIDAINNLTGGEME